MTTPNVTEINKVAERSHITEEERERNRAYYMSTRREYNPNSDKPVCQGGPRWYR